MSQEKALSEMGHCRDCQHWNAGAPSGGEVPYLASCDSPKFVRGYDWDEPVDLDGVRVENDEHWGFLTGPDFGCVHFVRRADLEVEG